MKKRRQGGGRKQTQLENPFIINDQWGDPINILEDTEYKLDIKIEDTLVGVCKAYHADKEWDHKQEYVNWQKLLRVYRNCTILNRQNIQMYLRCSERTAKRYVRVIKLCNKLLDSLIANKQNVSIKGYVHLTTGQVRAGYTNTEIYKTGEHDEKQYESNSSRVT